MLTQPCQRFPTATHLYAKLSFVFKLELHQSSNPALGKHIKVHIFPVSVFSRGNSSYDVGDNGLKLYLLKVHYPTTDSSEPYDSGSTLHTNQLSHCLIQSVHWSGGFTWCQCCWRPAGGNRQYCHLAIMLKKIRLKTGFV